MPGEAVQVQVQVKRCPRCGAVEQFGRNRRAADGLQRLCPSCRTAYLREHKRRTEAEVIAALGGRCACCGLGGERGIPFLGVYDRGPPLRARHGDILQLRGVRRFPWAGWYRRVLKEAADPSSIPWYARSNNLPKERERLKARRAEVARKYFVLCHNCAWAIRRSGGCPHRDGGPLPPPPEVPELLPEDLVLLRALEEKVAEIHWWRYGSLRSPKALQSLAKDLSLSLPWMEQLLEGHATRALGDGVASSPLLLAVRQWDIQHILRALSNLGLIVSRGDGYRPAFGLAALRALYPIRLTPEELGLLRQLEDGVGAHWRYSLGGGEGPEVVGELGRSLLLEVETAERLLRGYKARTPPPGDHGGPKDPLGPRRCVHEALRALEDHGLAEYAYRGAEWHVPYHYRLLAPWPIQG